MQRDGQDWEPISQPHLSSGAQRGPSVTRRPPHPAAACRCAAAAAGRGCGPLARRAPLRRRWRRLGFGSDAGPAKPHGQQHLLVAADALESVQHHCRQAAATPWQAAWRGCWRADCRCSGRRAVAAAASTSALAAGCRLCRIVLLLLALLVLMKLLPGRWPLCRLLQLLPCCKRRRAGGVCRLAGEDRGWR